MNTIKHKKNTILIAIAGLSVVLLLSYINLNEYLMAKYHQEFVIISFFIYLSFILAWFASIRYRIIDKDARRYISYICLLMIFFISVRSLKWGLLSHPDLQILFWYCYYIPIIVMPQFLLIISIGLDKNLRKKYTKTLVIIRIISTMLALFILTNNLHQSVFKIIEWHPTYDIIEYMWGFHIIYTYVVFLYLASIFFIVRNSKIPQTNNRVKLPLFTLIVYAVYTFLYTIFTPRPGIGYIEVTVMVCLIIGTLIESLIQSRLIPSNSDYNMIFENIDIAMLIVDKDYNTVYKSKNDFDLAKNNYKNIDEQASLIIDNKKFSASKINNGHILWATDISNINKKISEINEANIEIAIQNDELEKQVLLEKKELSIKHRNEIYQKLELETKPKSNQIYQIIQNNSNLSRDKLIEICLIGTYIKRLSNMSLIGSNSNTINAIELENAILESLSTYKLKYNTINSEDYLDFIIDFTVAKNLYEYFEKELEYYFYIGADLSVIWTLKDRILKISIIFNKQNITASSIIEEYKKDFTKNGVSIIEEQTENIYKIEFFIKEATDV